MSTGIFHLLKECYGGQQLICFPYLGGYANSLLELVKNIGEKVEVWVCNPPGHGTCSRKPMTEIGALVDLYYQELKTIMKPNSVFFGHSMGGVVSYFLAQKILQSDSYSAKLSKIIISASAAPEDYRKRSYSTLSDDALLQHMFSYNGLAKELEQEKALLKYFLPVFRADFEVLKSASDHPSSPLEIPAYCLWGENDKIVPIHAIAQWSKNFVNPIAITSISNGSHMFVHDQAPIVAQHIENIMFPLNT